MIFILCMSKLRERGEEIRYRCVVELGLDVFFIYCFGWFWDLKWFWRYFRVGVFLIVFVVFLNYLFRIGRLF